jgi:hypothetical protein
LNFKTGSVRLARHWVIIREINMASQTKDLALSVWPMACRPAHLIKIGLWSYLENRKDWDGQERKKSASTKGVSLYEADEEAMVKSFYELSEQNSIRPSSPDALRPRRISLGRLPLMEQHRLAGDVYGHCL